jgi:hypothetical protein
MTRAPLAAATLTVLTLTLGALAGSGLAQELRKRPMLMEPETSIELPVTLNVTKKLVGQRITGMAAREKTMFAIDIYACGHYVDADEARAELWKWKGKTADELADDDDFRKKLVTPGFGRTLRLHLARDLDTEDFNEAFDDSLDPRVRKLVKDGVSGALEDIRKLKGFFKAEELFEGTKIDLTWIGSTLHVAQDVKQLGTIESDALCRAMWDIYFGDDPIQTRMPRKLIDLFPKILETAEKPKPAAGEEDGKGEKQEPTPLPPAKDDGKEK